MSFLNANTPLRSTSRRLLLIFGSLLLLAIAPDAFSHAVQAGDKGYIQQIEGIALAPFMYLGAKHMVTGYDHLLFLFGVIFFLYRIKDVALYVSLFALGHSLTLITGVFLDLGINAYLIDAIIGLSVVYKALDNLGGVRMLGLRLDARWMVFAFGLCHGLGLASKLQDLALPEEGLLGNLIAFNVGVELGQILALSLILIVVNHWRQFQSFTTYAYRTNVMLMFTGFLLAGMQLSGYVFSLA